MTSGGCRTTAALGTTGARNALLVPATEGLANSLVIALAASLIALVLGSSVAYLVSRPEGGRGSAVLDGLFMLPLGVSAVTVGFGFLITLDGHRSTCAARRC